jgi:diguanylate cyclase (GGDEF)-like protein
MKSQLSLRATLIAAFGTGLFLVALAELATRYFFQLPELYRQEHANDVQAVRQVQHALRLEVGRKEAIAYDNAWWRDAYDFMAYDEQSAAYAEFVEQEYGFPGTMHGVLQVDGYAYLHPDGRVHFSSVHEHRSLAPGAAIEIPLEKLTALLGDGNASSVGGFLATEPGATIFVLATITDDEGTLPPAGYLALWRSADDGFFAEVTGSPGIRFTRFDGLRDGDLLARLEKRPDHLLPRDKADATRWILEDLFGEPLFLVTQPLPRRVFDDGLVSAGSLAGLCMTLLLLLAFSAMISRRIVEPVEQLTQFLRSLARSEDFSQRLHLERADEMGVVARHFDHLLDIVESQDRDLREQNRSLSALADHDSLTGVHNRRVFDRALQRDWTLAMRYKWPLSCIMVDVDFFGSFNDRYGHPAGDDALVQIGRALQGSVNRASDTLCRYGGEEFVVLLIETDEAAALQLARRLLDAIEQLRIPNERSDVSVFVTASAGVATLVPAPGGSYDTLVKAADTALYRAKAAGRNRVSTQDLRA